MNAALVSIMLATTLAIALLGLGERFAELKRCYYFGISLWATWLPVICAIFFISAFGMSLSAESSGRAMRMLRLNLYFSTSEMLILFLAGPLLLTRYGPAVALLGMAYTTRRLFITGNLGGHGMTFILACTTVIALLGDKMPWTDGTSHERTVEKIREVLLVVISVAAITIIFLAMTRLNHFTRWMSVLLSLGVAKEICLVILFGLFSGWLTVALGLTRHLILPVLCLPTVVIFAYTVRWPSYFLIIPVTACLALSLAAAERRHLSR